MRCRARQYSDQMVCHVCNLTWDMNDAEPPPCSPTPIANERRTNDRRKNKNITQEQFDELSKWARNGFKESEKPNSL